MPGSEPRLAGPQRPAVHLADVAAGHAERGVVGADGLFVWPVEQAVDLALGVVVLCPVIRAVIIWWEAA